MKERLASCAREVRAAFGIILVVGPLLWATALEAVGQCSSQLMTHSNGVIEGSVSCIGDKSSSSAVGIDVQDQFIVSFEFPRVSPASGVDVFVQRFANDGIILGEVLLSKNRFWLLDIFFLTRG